MIYYSARRTDAGPRTALLSVLNGPGKDDRDAGDAVVGAGVQPRRSGIGEVIRRYRQQAGLSQEELGERADLSVRAVRNLELGKVRRPRRGTLHRIGLALGLDAAVTAQLVAIAESMPNPLPAAATGASCLTSAWIQLRPALGQLIDQLDPKRLLVVLVLADCPSCAVNAIRSPNAGRSVGDGPPGTGDGSSHPTPSGTSRFAQGAP